MIDHATKLYTRRYRIVWRRILRVFRHALIRDRFDPRMPGDWQWPR